MSDVLRAVLSLGFLSHELPVLIATQGGDYVIGWSAAQTVLVIILGSGQSPEEQKLEASARGCVSTGQIMEAKVFKC
jgi:hypothetical protein